MTAGKKEATSFNKLPGYLVISRVKKEEQDDWVVFPFPGVIPLRVALATGADETHVHPTLKAASGSSPGVDAMSFEYDTAVPKTRPAGNYYLRAPAGEIILVSDDDGFESTTGTITIAKRGCFGTTPEALTGGTSVLQILCSLTLNQDATTGHVDVVFMPLPEDPGVNLYG